jgi:hypothetical protein
MHFTQQLFNSEEAFIRVGQTRQAGCLVIISPEGVVRLFVENGAVVNAFGEGTEGQKALENALRLPNASHLWMPESKPSKKTMEVNISAYALKHSVARDIHIAETGKVQIPLSEGQVPKKNEKKRFKIYYLIAEDLPYEKLIIGKGTVILGREESCDIVLNHIQVSRRHCLIQTVARGLSFRDLGSTNGVAVNGFPAQEGFLSPGDKLQLGSCNLTVRSDA